MPGLDFKNAQKRIAEAQGLIGALPGLAAILAGLGTPPERELLFKAFVASVIFVSAILVIASKDGILAMGARKRNVIIILGLIISGMAMIFYIHLFDRILVSDFIQYDCQKIEVTLYLPIFPLGELAELIDRAGRSGLISEFGLLQSNIEQYYDANWVKYLWTEIILLILYLTIVVPLTLSLVGVVIILTSS